MRIYFFLMIFLISPMPPRNVSAETSVSTTTQRVLYKLKAAFGGERVLQEISSISFALEMHRKSSGTKTKMVYIDFEKMALAQHTPSEDRYIFVRGDTGVEITNKDERELSKHEIDGFLKSITFNFLFYLTSEDLQLIDPTAIEGHKNLYWVNMQARGRTSPLVGVDLETGRISKVAGSTGSITLELDYLPTKSGLIWPHRFIVTRDQKESAKGVFSEVNINSMPFSHAPAWFRK